MPWRTIEGQEPASAKLLQLEVLIRGVFDRRRFLDLIRYGVVFDRDARDNVIKILAGYQPVPCHQRGRGRHGGGHAPARRPALRRGVAYAGQRQKPHHGLLRRADHSASGDGKTPPSL